MTQDFTSEDTEADYGKVYEGFYSKYYDELEHFAKDFFIENYEDDVIFNDAYNDFAELLRVDFVKDIYYIKNEKLNELRNLFFEKLSRYKKDSVQKVFKNIIKSKFDNIDVTQLPRDYNFIKFIDEVAFIQSKNEISRMLSYNYTYFDMIYELNRFDIFEIRYYHRLAKESYPYYKELSLEINSKDRENENLGVVVNEVQDLNENLAENENPLPRLFLNLNVYKCFIEYQKHIVDFYVDYSYLKKRLDYEKLIHYHKDNDFMKIIYDDLGLFSKKNYDDYCVYGKLKSLQKSYSVQRQNNFNLIFND